MIRVGCVPYLNAKPLWDQLDYPVVYQTPSQLAQSLSEKSLDLALVSSITYLENPNYKAYFEAGCIASDGPVESVLLFYKDSLAPQNIQSIHFTQQSKTSVLLAQIILNRTYQIPLKNLIPSHTPDAFLEIGDDALIKEYKGFKKLDLGYEWQQLTGLPFVYALWVANQNIPQTLIDTLIQARNQGIKMIDALAAQNTLLPQERAKHYLTKNIRYEMNSQTLKGLAEFQNQAFDLGLLSIKRDFK